MKPTVPIFAKLRARARVGIAIEAAGCILASAAVFVFASYALDRSLRLEVGFRVVLALLIAFVVGRSYLRRFHRPLKVELTDDEIALAVERCEPEMRQSLISAVQFDRDLASPGAPGDGESETLKRKVIDDVEGRLGRIRFHRALDGQRVRRYLALALLSIGLVGGWALAAPGEAGIWALRNLAFSDQPWPRDTYLAFLDVDVAAPYRLAEREDLTLRVQVEGTVPDSVELDCRFASGERARRPMDQIAEDVFSVTLESMLEGAVVTAYGGDGETQPLTIALVPRPRITELGLTIEHPAYMARDPEPVADTGGDVRVPRGGKLLVTAKSSKPLTRAAMVFAQDERVALEILDGGHGLSGTFTPTASGALLIEAIDRDDLGPSQPPQVYVRVIEDAAPILDFKTDGIGSLITQVARIPGVLTLRDDYGLRSVEASYRVTAAEPPTEGAEPKPEPEFEPAPFAGLDGLDPRSSDSVLDVQLDLEPLNQNPDPNSEENRLHPGQILSLRFSARDNFAPESHVGYSETLNLRVVTREKLLQELRRRQTEQRRELERVLTKELAARSELAEIVSPTSDDPRAAEARLRIEGLARQQTALGMRVQGIATRYRQILLEMKNNRLFEPGVTSRLDSRIVSPLMAMSLDGFPNSAAQTSVFADTGQEDTRVSAVEVYDQIIETIREVLAHMEKTEDLAAIVEALRIVLRTEEQAGELIEKLRNAQGGGIFAPAGRDRDDKEKAPKKGDRDRDRQRDGKKQ